MRICRIGVAILALVAAGCGSTTYGPKPEEMRLALLNMLDQRPDIFIPEFRDSLVYDKPVVQDGIVFIGSWNCDPKRESFDAVFSAPNITMYRISGRFEQDNRGTWIAKPRDAKLVQKQDIGEFWRPHELWPR
jgi:hypothetical protein